MIFNPTFFVLPKEASGIPKARNTWGEAWLQKRCSETEAGEQANRRTGEQAAGAKMCHDVPWCAMCKVRTKWQNQLQNQPHTALGSSRAQDLTAGHWARSYKAGVKPIFVWPKNEDNDRYIWNIHQIYHWCHLEIYNSWWYANNIKEGSYIWDWSTFETAANHTGEVRYTSDDD